VCVCVCVAGGTAVSLPTTVTASLSPSSHSPPIVTLFSALVMEVPSE